MQKIILLYLLLIILILCNYYRNNYYENQPTNIETGKFYLYSFDWDNKDPFKEIKIDTVKVVDIKNGYIKWEYKDGHCLSNKVNAFKKCKRQLN